MTKLMLVVLDLDKELRVEVDVSDYTIGGVLLMEYEDEEWSCYVCGRS